MTHNPINHIRDHVDVLSTSYAHWSTRDVDAADAGAARRACSASVDAIDALLRELHTLRQRIVSEAREYDDAVAERVDALLARRCTERDEAGDQQ